jgi:hypothetical protein
MSNIMNVTCFEILEGRDHSEDIGRDGNFMLALNLIHCGWGLGTLCLWLFLEKSSLLPRCTTDCRCVTEAC